MKKILQLILAGVAAGGLMALTGCASSPSTTTTTTTTTTEESTVEPATVH